MRVLQDSWRSLPGLIILLISIIPIILLCIIAYVLYRWWKKRKGEKQNVPLEKK